MKWWLVDEARGVMDAEQIPACDITDAVSIALARWERLTDADKRARETYAVVRAYDKNDGTVKWDTIDESYNVLAITGYGKRTVNDPCVDLCRAEGGFIASYDTIPEALDEINMRAAYRDDADPADYCICIDGYAVISGDGIVI